MSFATAFSLASWRHLRCLSEAQPAMRRYLVNPKRLMVNALACAALVVLWPSTAAAQWHGHGAFVVVGGGFYQPFYPFYAGWGWYPGWYGGYPFYPPYGGYWYGPFVRVDSGPGHAEAGGGLSGWLLRRRRRRL